MILPSQFLHPLLEFATTKSRERQEKVLRLIRPFENQRVLVGVDVPPIRIGQLLLVRVAWRVKQHFKNDRSMQFGWDNAATTRNQGENNA
jgi:hypothetical protein